MPNIYVFDLEGTLSNSKWREHLLPDYEKFHAAFPEDKPRKEILEINKNLSNHLNMGDIEQIPQFYILTGMMQKHSDKARKWLFENKVYYDAILMRDNNDLSRSADYKLLNIRGIIDSYAAGYVDGVFIFDDRDDIIEKFKFYSRLKNKHNEVIPIIPVQV